MSTVVKTRQQVPSPKVRIYFENPELQHLRRAIASTEKRVVPVWPLPDSVAVNPLGGWTGTAFHEVADELHQATRVDMLPPFEMFADANRQGQLSERALIAALDESDWGMFYASREDAFADLQVCLATSGPDATADAPKATDQSPTVSAALERFTQRPWSALIEGEIGKFCSRFFDSDTAQWKELADESLFSSWHQFARSDNGPRLLGIRRWQKFVKALPRSPFAALQHCLNQLQIPSRFWNQALLAHAYSLPGWMSYARFLDEESGRMGKPDNVFVGLLAVRLAYEAALSVSEGFVVDWDSVWDLSNSTFPIENHDDVLRFEKGRWQRQVLLQALEQSFSSGLLSKIRAAESTADETVDRPESQFLFCIDVRSERLRRHLESEQANIETFGVAGFFGAAVSLARLGETQSTAQCPVLVKPNLQLSEELDASEETRDQVAERRRLTRARRWLWKAFNQVAYSSFSFIECVGGLFSIPLISRTLGVEAAGTDDGRFDGVPQDLKTQLRPELKPDQGTQVSDLTDLAEGLLRNIGLTKSFAKLVVVCGHHSQTANNPQAANLQCGACGGHSGETNARFMANILNDWTVRETLEGRGISIPDDCRFLPGTHNTTTDEITFYDQSLLGQEYESILRDAHQIASAAAAKCRTERAVELHVDNPQELFARATCWSEIRPEWGLAGNAAFIIAPREMTRSLNLGGASFLHSYEQDCDADGAILEGIMTAPLVVAHWINMQYYASTVMPQQFGAGSKTIHNIVGDYGVLAGESGDLQAGLAWESVHDGTEYRHLARRLSAVIAADRHAIDRVLGNHKLLENLVVNKWIHLYAIEDGNSYRCQCPGEWERVSELPSSPNDQAVLN